MNHLLPPLLLALLLAQPSCIVETDIQDCESTKECSPGWACDPWLKICLPDRTALDGGRGDIPSPEDTAGDMPMDHGPQDLPGDAPGDGADQAVADGADLDFGDRIDGQGSDIGQAGDTALDDDVAGRSDR